MIERSGLFVFKGQDVTIVGEDVKVGEQAPEFSALKRDWTWMSALESTKGKVRIIGSLPSLSTSVCDRETKKFNLEASSMSDDIAILMVSMDLPFTHDQWCAAAGVDQVTTLSDHKNAAFGEKYGVLLKELNIFRRAAFVVDRTGKFVYVEYLPVLGDEPDYEAVLEAARTALDLN
ncbi:MAG: thiol peroxidase [Chloroflexota bacterium]|nr:MAG: thiol peroxidase [Chloroflexota bacterium]